MEATATEGSKSSGQPWLILISLFALAFLLRIVGVDHGYFHGDERINDAAKVLTGQLVPGQHFYPPLVHYLNGVAFGVLFAAGFLLGVWRDTAEFEAQYFSDPTPFYLTARMVTAAVGALIAPLFFVAARRLLLPMRHAVAVGVLGVLLPIGIYQSHLSKGDVPLATATVLLICLLIVRHQPGASARHDIALGVAVAIAVSFKQSFVFLLLPLAVMHGWLLWRSGGAVARPLSVSFATAALLWPMLNIGILLDLGNFLDYQRIQRVMSVSEGSPWGSVSLWAARGASAVEGITPLGFLLALVFPIWLASRWCAIPQKVVLACIWGALVLSTLLILILVGERQPEHLWLPQFSVMQLLAGLMIADLVRRSWIGGALLAASVLGSVYGAAAIAEQALSKPVRDDLQELLVERFADRKILTGVALELPQAEDARKLDAQRLERLAKKYSVTLPNDPRRRVASTAHGQALYYRLTPPVMYGLEDADDEDLRGIVKPHAWPLQPEEWRLEGWLAQGVDLFVVSNLDYAINDTPSKLYRAFWADVAERCVVAAELEPRKPLFLERRVSVLDCSDRR